jgi:hypothetical protein
MMITRLTSCLLFVGLIGAPLVASAQTLPAFPGADGAGGTVAGGRGGIVYHVTRLDQNYSDTAAGTLRYGLTDSNFPAGTPRTIVFDVAGTFWLGRYGADRGHYDGWDASSRLNIGTNVTIAGQTAPGPVNIMGGVIKFSNTSGINNSIVRNVLVAPGYGMRSFEKPDETPPVYPDPGNPVIGSPATPRDYPDSYVFDAFDIAARQIMIDHVSTYYATDETISVNELGGDITVQYTTVAQAQNYPQADAEGSSTRYTGHGLGSLLQAGSNAEISIINNLYAHLAGRVPRVGSEVGTGAFNDFRNNVFYNWYGTAGAGASGQPSFNNFVNNFYLAGPGGDSVSQTAGEDGTMYTADDLPRITTVGGGTGIFNGSSSTVTRVFASGNLKDTNKDGDPNDTASADGNYTNSSLQTAAYNVDIGVTLSAAAAYNNVMNYVGPRWWERDATVDTIDERIIHETQTGTGKVVAWADDPFNDYETPPDPNYDPYDPDEGAEWRGLLSYRADPVTGAAPYNRAADWDTDSDGMPDYWEAEHGLDTDVANNNADFDSDGYTDVEEYLNDLAAWPAPGEIVFNGASSRYAEILNWQVSGQTVNIQGTGVVTTKSYWQPSRYDTAVINNGTVVVDAVGQHAGTLVLGANPGDNATLSVTAGWLKVEDQVVIGADDGATATLALSGGELSAPLLSKGAGGSMSFTGGALHADGVDFDLTNNGGTLAPGNSTGSTLIDGDYDQLAGGTLEIEIASLTDFDIVGVTGEADLAGVINVILDSSFTLGEDDTFDILVAGTLVDSGIALAAGGDNDLFRLETDTETGVVTLWAHLGVSGDYNDDGLVDAADYTVWRDTLAAGSTDLPNDDTPGEVDETDYAVWKANFGMTAGSGAASNAAVPEPTAGALALMGLLCLCFLRGEHR